MRSSRTGATWSGRRTRFELRQAEAQREVVEGLGVAVADVDRVVRTIRESADADAARLALMRLPLSGLEGFVRRAGRPEEEIAAAKARTPYTLSERQAKAILEMRLSRLTGLEQREAGEGVRGSLRSHRPLQGHSREPEASRRRHRGGARRDQGKYGDKRRTEIVPSEGEIEDEDLIQEEDMIVTISHAGYIKRTSPRDYRAQKRGGRGRIGMEAREEDWVTQLFAASTHAYVFFFSDKGKVYVKKVYEIPLAARTSKGRAIVNFIGMESGEKVAAIVEVPKIQKGHFVVTLTKFGQIKKTELDEYENFREKGIIGVKVDEGDQLLSAALTDGTRSLLIATKNGQSIRFPEDQTRPMGRATHGVKGIDISEGDEVVGLVVSDEARPLLLAVCANGFGKRTHIDEFRTQNRGGKGVILIDASERNGPVVGVKLVKERDEVMLITDRGQTIRTRVERSAETGRNAQGVRLMTLGDGERIVAVERLAETEVEDGGMNLPPADGLPPSSDLN